MKVLKIIGLVVLCSFILFIVSSLIFISKSEKEIKQFAVSEFNKKLTVPVQVAEIELSLWKRFPNITLSFNKVIIPSSIDLNNEKTNLLELDDLLLQFNIIKLFKKEYTVDKIELKSGVLNIIFDKRDNNNFDIWKPSEVDEESSNFSLELNNFLLREIKLNYHHLAQNEKIISYIPNLNLEGNFSQNIFELKTFGQINIHQIFFSDIEYIKDKNLTFDIIAAVDNENDAYRFERGKLTIENIKFSVSGKVDRKDEDYFYVDVKIDGDNINISELNKLSPQLLQISKNYRINGFLDFKAHISGENGKYTRPSLDVDFSFENASFLDNTNTKVNIEQVDLVGKYSTGKTNTAKTNFIIIENFSAKTAGSMLNGNIEIENFENPKLKGKIIAEGNAMDIFAYLALENVKEIGGKLRADIDFKGNLENFQKFTQEDIEKLSISGNLYTENFSILIDGYNNPLSNLKSSMNFRNKSILINSLEGNIKDTDFSLKGRIDNLLSYLFFGNTTIVIDAALFSDKINLTQLLTAPDSKKDGDEFAFALPPFLEFSLFSRAKELIFNKFEAKNVNINFDYRNNKFSCENIELEAFDGLLKGALSFNFIDFDNIKTYGDINVDNGNIQKMFYQLEGFGQDFITEKNLRGKLSGNAQFSITLNQKLDVISKSIIVNSHLKIIEGELINFETLNSLSEYISVEELKHVKFSTLENDIFIKNSVVEIPLMEINSSAFNLKLSGIHGFDNKIDYHFGIFLKDVLALKAQKKKKENIEFGDYDPKKENKLTLFVGMKGTVENPKFYYEKIGVKDKFKQDLKTEKETLKGMLKEEFNLFKNDTSVKVNNTQKDNFKYEIEWDELDDTTTKKDETEQKKLSPIQKALEEEKKKEKKKNWLDKISGEKEKKEEFDKFDPTKD
jgi:hypothetical protein